MFMVNSDTLNGIISAIFYDYCECFTPSVLILDSAVMVVLFGGL